MARPLVDLLWRDHPAAPGRGTRGPASRHSTGEVVDQAIALADGGGLVAVTIRALASALEMSAMSVYTHVNSRNDLLVLMADRVCQLMPPPPLHRAGWRARVTRVAEANFDLYRERPWLLEITDPRCALGPGTIAKYDHELHAFDRTGLGDLERDAALTFVLDLARSAAADSVRSRHDPDFTAIWSEAGPRVATYLGTDAPLARQVGSVAGAALEGPYDAGHAWAFGLARALDGLGAIIDDPGTPPDPRRPG